MEKIASLADFSYPTNVPVFLCIGNFDGVHRGHRALFELAKKTARTQNGIWGALTFSPHPEVFFRGNAAARSIYSQTTKFALFEEIGLDFAVVQAFSTEFAKIPAEDFLTTLKKSVPSLTGIFVGENFRFGAGRKGDVALLRERAQSLDVEINALEPVLFKSERISSTRIRKELEFGEIDSANSMLGKPYFAAGTIVSGRQLGRTIGFPTLNLAWNPELRPRFGVYAVCVKCGNRSFPGVANYGVRPTVERGGVPEPLLETFLLNIPEGTEIPTYGDWVFVEWRKFLREERRFDSLDALREQLAEDRRQAEAFSGNI